MTNARRFTEGDKAAARYRQLEAELDERRARTEEARIAAQLACPHIDIVEGAYVPNEYGSSQAPFRVCLMCGLAERGWSCGYQVLRGAAVEVGRKEAQAFVRGPVHRNHLFVVTLVERSQGLTREEAIAQVIKGERRKDEA